ncbi:transglutaminase-like cysteine peptidase [Thiobacillus sp.]|uniref:transglutaminase-like cysteine peptidase n=1 Tax=Thiobacillus sp. TaxID=924 RepID=UPI00286E8B55|nr:transglutaminase-like cysteine peptidase [Thiobacillus sp.]
MLKRCSVLNCRQALSRTDWAASICTLAFSVSVALAGVEMDRLLMQAGQRYGDAGTASVVAWRDLLTRAASQPDAVKLRQVNDFFNRRIRFGEDSDIWGKQDYWATPLETLGRSEGDCEDFAIAKYATLKQLGIPAEKLRLTYVKARIGGPQSTLVQAHMVLSYYPAPDDEPLVLDNLIGDIRPASRRADLTTIFGFNAEGLWIGGGAPRAPSASQRLSKWQSVLTRMREEGIE